MNFPWCATCHHLNGKNFNINSNDDDFIEASLGGMGYNCRLYKKTIPNYKFIRGQFQIIIKKKKKNILQVVMFQNVLMVLRY